MQKLCSAGCVSRKRLTSLLLQPRHVSSCKLPATVALYQRVRELHDTIEWLALGRSFHMRLAGDHSCVVAIGSSLHIVILELVVVNLAATHLIDLICARAYLAIGKSQSEVRGQHTLKRGLICIKKCFARVAFELEYLFFERSLGERSGRLKQSQG